MSRLLLLLFCFFLYSTSGHAKLNKFDVVWSTENFPPFYILDGKLKNQGIVDQLITIISEQIPEYNHSRKLMPILRIVDELQAESQIVCASFLHDPKIEGFSIYSDPIFAVPPQQLILRRETWQQLGRPANYSLNKLLTSQEFSLGLSIGRNYGTEVSKILAGIGKKHAFIYYRAGDHFLGLAEMLRQGRLDATIGYSGEARFYMRKPDNADILVNIPIVENTKPFPVYAVMPKTAWGKKFRKTFNLALARSKKDPTFRRAVLNWFHPTPDFTKSLDNILQNN